MSNKWIQFVMNLTPLIGVIFFGWNIFALLYVFWLETLALSFFQGCRILLAQGGDEKGPHLTMALTFFGFRIGLLLFYLLFMVVFIGVMIATKQGNGVEWVSFLLLIDPLFRATIIVFFLMQSTDFILTYLLNEKRKVTDPKTLYRLFDLRFVVIHVVLILGFFAFDYIEKVFGVHKGILAFTSVFVLFKCLYDLFSQQQLVLNSTRN